MFFFWFPYLVCIYLEAKQLLDLQIYRNHILP